MRSVGIALTLRSVALLAIALSGCGKKDEKDLAKLDAKLTANATDPALREAIEAPIATDPDLRGEANRDAVRPPDKPLAGTVPPFLSSADAREQARRLAGGALMPVPDADRRVTSTKEPFTLGGKAAKLAGGTCDPHRIQYGFGWAARLPEALPLYPDANLIEAAGADEAPCIARAASFTTAAAPSDILDFYYTMARRAGYAVDHVEQNGEGILTGSRARDRAAFVVMPRPSHSGGTVVDIIADHGR